jgi:hypothetical protein
MMNPDTIRASLLKQHGLNMEEIYQVTTFRCYRTAANGVPQTVIVNVLDAGPDVPSDLRYSCVALTQEGHFAAGNPGGTIDEALAIVHWGQLDRPPEHTNYWR